jgi:hypothetical protein
MCLNANILEIGTRNQVGVVAMDFGRDQDLLNGDMHPSTCTEHDVPMVQRYRQIYRFLPAGRLACSTGPVPRCSRTTAAWITRFDVPKTVARPRGKFWQTACLLRSQTVKKSTFPPRAGDWRCGTLCPDSWPVDPWRKTYLRGHARHKGVVSCS